MSTAKHLPPEALDAWLGVAAAELEVDPSEAPTSEILKVAADVAHGVARPAAPLSTFLLGLAMGRGARDGESFHDLAARLSTAAERWEEAAE